MKYVLVLVPFQQMSIKRKKSLFSNITRDYNYHKSIFHVTLNFHNILLLTVTGERVPLFVSMDEEESLELFPMYFTEFTASATNPQLFPEIFIFKILTLILL